MAEILSLQEIKDKAREGATSEETLARLDALIAAQPDNEEALIERGMLHWGMGQRALTINDYLAALKLNPEGKAKQALAAVYSILDFYNKDLYNP